jgi:hypothetical protein
MHGETLKFILFYLSIYLFILIAAVNTAVSEQIVLLKQADKPGRMRVRYSLSLEGTRALRCYTPTLPTAKTVGVAETGPRIEAGYLNLGDARHFVNRLNRTRYLGGCKRNKCKLYIHVIAHRNKFLF